jgi:hypothetical protein
MLRKEFRRKEISRRLSRQIGFVLTVELIAGLLLSIGVVALFAEIVEEVVEGESRRFDETALLWINAHFAGWLDGPKLVFTALGYYWAVPPFLGLAVYAFHHIGTRSSAALLLISIADGLVLTMTLKASSSAPARSSSTPDTPPPGTPSRAPTLPSPSVSTGLWLYA